MCPRTSKESQGAEAIQEAFREPMHLEEGLQGAGEIPIGREEMERHPGGKMQTC